MEWVGIAGAGTREDEALGKLGFNWTVWMYNSSSKLPDSKSLMLIFLFSSDLDINIIINSILLWLIWFKLISLILIIPLPGAPVERDLEYPPVWVDTCMVEDTPTPPRPPLPPCWEVDVVFNNCFKFNIELWLK